jgi:hypothetical protein
MGTSMHLKIIVLVLTASATAHASGNGSYKQMSDGLWRLEWPNGRLGYMCVNEDFQPWQIIPYDGFSSCFVEDATWKERGGNQLRQVRSKTERQWREGDTYSVQTDCLLLTFSASQGPAPWSTSLTQTLRSWRGDFEKQVTYRDSVRFFSKDVEVDNGGFDLAPGEHQMNRVGACPVSLPAGRRCTIPSVWKDVEVEWPACGADLPVK